MEYLRDTIIYKLLFAQKTLVSAVRGDFVDVDITHENYITLHFIYENPGITQNELALLSGKDKNVIVKSVDRLESLGFASRVRSTDDRRSFCLYVTESGKKIISKYWKRLVERQNEALSALTEKEKHSLDEILGKIIG